MTQVPATRQSLTMSELHDALVTLDAEQLPQCDWHGNDADPVTCPNKATQRATVVQIDDDRVVEDRMLCPGHVVTFVVGCALNGAKSATGMFRIEFPAMESVA